jgi:hypothetical protein
VEAPYHKIFKIGKSLIATTTTTNYYTKQPIKKECPVRAAMATQHMSLLNQ